MREGGTSDWVTGQRTLHHLAEDGGILEEKREGEGGRGKGKGGERGKREKEEQERRGRRGRR